MKAEDYQLITIYAVTKSDDNTEYADVEFTFAIDGDADLEEVGEYMESTGLFQIEGTDRVKVGVMKGREGRRIYRFHDWQSKIDRIKSHAKFKPNKKLSRGKVSSKRQGKGQVRANKGSKREYLSKQDRLTRAYIEKGD